MNAIFIFSPSIHIWKYNLKLLLFQAVIICQIAVVCICPKPCTPGWPGWWQPSCSWSWYLLRSDDLTSWTQPHGGTACYLPCCSLAPAHHDLLQWHYIRIPLFCSLITIIKMTTKNNSYLCSNFNVNILILYLNRDAIKQLF